MPTNRREFLRTSLGNGLKLAGIGSLTSLARIDQMLGATQDEDGYVDSPERRKLEEEQEKEVLPLGSPAPNWLRSQEAYNAWYVPWSEDILQNWLKDFSLIVGVPHERRWVDQAHRLGIRVIPYVSFYKSVNIPMAQKSGWTFWNALPSPFWSELDLSKHPEWMLYDKKDVVRTPFNDPKYPPQWKEVCTASPGYHEAALKGVQALLDLGMDGLFIDNVHPTPHCYGPAFGKHAHVNGLDNLEAYKKLIADIYAMVKKSSSAKIVALNPGHVNPAYWAICDTMMYESYICTTPDAGYTCSKGWDPILRKAKNCQRAIQSGKVVLILSYFSGADFFGADQQNPPKTPPLPPAKEDIFYSYACARVSGFAWSDYFTLPKHHPAQVLYTLRLGRMLGDMEEIDGVYLRRFQHGIVAVNSSGGTKQIQLPRVRMARLRDIYEGKVVEVSGGSLPVEIAGQSGRVYASFASS